MRASAMQRPEPFDEPDDEEDESNTIEQRQQQQQPAPPPPPIIQTPFGYPSLPEPDDIVQVVYQSGHNGSLVGVESSLLSGADAAPASAIHDAISEPYNPMGLTSHQQLTRAGSTLPSVAEESTGMAMGAAPAGSEQTQGGSLERHPDGHQIPPSEWSTNTMDSSQYGSHYNTAGGLDLAEPGLPLEAIYSTINRREQAPMPDSVSDQTDPIQGYYDAPPGSYEPSPLSGYTQAPMETGYVEGAEGRHAAAEGTLVCVRGSPDVSESSQLDKGHLQNQDSAPQSSNQDTGEPNNNNNNNNKEDDDDDGLQLGRLARQSRGVAESGSFRNNFRKKLAVSTSSNENELHAHRQKLLESQTSVGTGGQPEPETASLDVAAARESSQAGDSKFKRTHSVSFNVGSQRSGRMSVDIKNLPSYLTNKRASIVDVARGAMSSLMHSFGSNAGSSASSLRRDSSADDDDLAPIFDEPIAPTLSLGQRVALVKELGAEFGTVGWIGQLPGVEDDWVVGVVFDNQIGNCDGMHNEVRYFYSRPNYAMFVPLSMLVKTDNYIGRPETGTMLSRMSVSLKPGQMISIQRSSIRLQHCFLNAPHQRVGHDVRAVSNRLHCQCHNCGPCAHLTKQGRAMAMPTYGTTMAHSHSHAKKKNSLAHAAVEIIAHHHHHFHDDEHEQEPADEHQFGDNAAHACNFVRYSCCQQAGSAGHEFSADCNMVRPELLDNLIHAPRAPHTRTMRRRRTRAARQRAKQELALGYQPNNNNNNNNNAILPYSNNSLAIQYNNNDNLFDTLKSHTTVDSDATALQERAAETDSAGSSAGSSADSSPGSSPGPIGRKPVPSPNSCPESCAYGNCETGINASAYMAGSSVYNTLDTQVSLVDQQRFIFQRNSSAFMHSEITQYDQYSDSPRPTRLAAALRRCFGCLTNSRNRQRDLDRGRRRAKHRKRRPKMSARNKIIEYRRRQSTFVPSTLAKPQEDFTAHGAMMGPSHGQLGPQMHDSRHQSHGHGDHHSNSDYSSCTRSSCGSSRSSSPPSRPGEHAGAYAVHQAGLTMQQAAAPDPNADYNWGRSRDGSLANTSTVYKVEDCSRDSALTDMAYFESLANASSNDTLKNIVDAAVNEHAPRTSMSLGSAGAPYGQQVLGSPVSSSSGCELCDAQLDISSATVSLGEMADGLVGQAVAAAVEPQAAHQEAQMAHMFQALQLDRQHHEGIGNDLIYNQDPQDLGPQYYQEQQQQEELQFNGPPTSDT